MPLLLVPSRSGFRWRSSFDSRPGFLNYWEKVTERSAILHTSHSMKGIENSFWYGFSDKKLQKILPLEDYFRDGLYGFDVGQNDLDGAFYSKSEDQVAAFIPTILSEFEAGVEVVHFLF